MILQNGCNLNWMQPFLILFCSQCHSALATSLWDFFNSPYCYPIALLWFSTRVE